MRLRKRWLGLGAFASVAGCLGFPDALPDPLGHEDSGTSTISSTVLGTSSGAETSGTTVSVASAGSTGPVAMCGNELVEEDEACDGTDLNGETCESLGQPLGALACTSGCSFDLSGCVPPGMVDVPGGVFEMGSDYDSSQQPIRQVTVDRFWIDETEVTVAAYAACVADVDGCSEPSTGTYCNWTMAGREDHPVNCVTWFQAEEYCAWAGKQLPTEAQWEKAARGTDAREYPWGAELPTCTRVVMAEGGTGCDMGSTWSVGSKPLGDSPYGAHDMAGNVFEWVADYYASGYDPLETDNPTGPARGTLRVLRGGSWDFSNTSFFRAAFRSVNSPANGGNYVGFRCARTPPAPL